MSNLDAVMVDIESLGVGTPEYHEALWFLLSIMARRQAAIAESIRVNQRRRDRAAATREANRLDRVGRVGRPGQPGGETPC